MLGVSIGPNDVVALAADEIEEVEHRRAAHRGVGWRAERSRVVDNERGGTVTDRDCACLVVVVDRVSGRQRREIQHMPAARFRDRRPEGGIVPVRCSDDIGCHVDGFPRLRCSFQPLFPATFTPLHGFVSISGRVCGQSWTR